MIKLRESHSRRSTPHTHTCWLALFLSVTPTDNIILFSLVAADGQVCDYRPTSKTHRYIYPHSAACCVDTEMSAGDKWNDKFRNMWGCHISHYDWSTILLEVSMSWGGWLNDKEKEKDHQQALFVRYIQFVFITHGPSHARMHSQRMHQKAAWQLSMETGRTKNSWTYNCTSCLIWSVSPEKSAG